MTRLLQSMTLFTCFFLLVAGFAMAQDSKVKIKPELEPLKNYLGDWDSEYRIAGNSSSTNSELIKGTVTGSWAVGGTYMEQSGESLIFPTGNKFRFKTIMAYNKSTKRFDYYYFYSSGEVVKGEATWDAKNKVMTTVRTESNGQQVEITANFSKPDVETWVIEVKDQNGQSKMRIEGTNKRRQK